jgi:hypothetical protein
MQVISIKLAPVHNACTVPADISSQYKCFGSEKRGSFFLMPTFPKTELLKKIIPSLTLLPCFGTSSMILNFNARKQQLKLNSKIKVLNESESGSKLKNYLLFRNSEVLHLFPFTYSHTRMVCASVSLT